MDEKKWEFYISKKENVCRNGLKEIEIQYLQDKKERTMDFKKWRKVGTVYEFK